MTSSPDLTAAAIKMAISLILVLAIVWGMYRVARKIMPAARGASGGKMIRVVENQYLGLKKNLLMVQVPGALLILGVTADKIQLLARLDDADTIAQIDAQNSGNISDGVTFKSQLQRLMGSKKNIGQQLHERSVTE